MSTEQERAEVRDAGERQPDTVEGETVGAPADSDVAALRSQLEEQQARADRCMANWQRAEADLANLKRRTEQERAELARFANASLIAKLLPIVDDLDRAIEAIPQKEGLASWVEGVKLIDHKLRSLLEQEGVTSIEALGKEFDPHVHEAVLREDGEGDVDVVVEELQKGYKLHDRVLRPAMVKVGRRSSTSDQDKKE